MGPWTSPSSWMGPTSGSAGAKGEARPGPYAAAVREWLELGATIVGGCCGTTLAHIAAVAAIV